MATSKKERNRKAREYYRKNKKYREQKIQDRKEYYKEHRQSQNAYERKRYRKNPSYRKYKIAYAKAYQKRKKRK